MKPKHFILFTISLIVIIAFNACDKEENTTKTSIQNKTEQMDLSIQIIPNPHPITDYLINENDKDEEKINTHLYEICLIARNIFIDESYNDLVISEALKHDNSCVDLIWFTEKAKGLKSSKSNVFEELNYILNKIDLSHKSTNPYNKGEVEDYIPAIFVVNAEIADFSKTPIISSGTYVNSTIQGLEDYDEYIVAWTANEDGSFNEILINEEMAL